MNFTPYPCLGAPIDGACPQTPTYPARECTSGGAWWGSRFTGKPWPEGWGNADNWPSAARAAGFTVNTTPASNSIMCIPPNTNGSGPKGHIAYVVGEPVGGKVLVWEMNFLIEHGFDYRLAATAHCEYVHLTGSVIHPPAPVGDKDLTPQQDQMLTDIHKALFEATAPEGTAPWNNNEIMRRMLAQIGADYNLRPGPVPPAKP